MTEVDLILLTVAFSLHKIKGFIIGNTANSKSFYIESECRLANCLLTIRFIGLY